MSINSAAVVDPGLIANCSKTFGAQCIVVAIDARKNLNDGTWQIFTHGGTQPTGLDAVDWARKVEKLGAGELLITSMDKDGTKTGFDTGLTRAISSSVGIPVIASGGVGELNHFLDGLVLGKADAVLAASVFHFGTFSIQETKKFLQDGGVNVRLN